MKALPLHPGHIRAFDIRTGKQKWIFHTIPFPGELGYNTWEDTAAYKHIGGANAWSGLTLDEERGIVFVPTGSASFDFYGGKRRGDNLFANTYWHWMQQPVNASGIFKPFITICGIMIYRHHLPWSPLIKMEKKLMRWRSPQKQVLYSFLIEKQESLFIQLKKDRCLTRVN